MNTKEKLEDIEQAIVEIRDSIEAIKFKDKLKTDYAINEAKITAEKLLQSAITLLSNVKDQL